MVTSDQHQEVAVQAARVVSHRGEGIIAGSRSGKTQLRLSCNLIAP